MKPDFGSMPRRIAIVQKVLPHYRLSFFEQLRGRLAQEGVELRLIYSDPVGIHAQKNDTVAVDWAIKVPARLLMRWERDEFMARKLDHDSETGVINNEIRILPPKYPEMNQFLQKD